VLAGNRQEWRINNVARFLTSDLAL
jgi:hypothetical protein